MTYDILKLEMHKFQVYSMNSVEFNEILSALLIILTVIAKISFLWSHLMMLEDYVVSSNLYDNEKEVIVKFKVKIYIFGFL